MRNPDKDIRRGFVSLLFLKFLVGVFIELFFFTILELRNHLVKVVAGEVDFFDITPEFGAILISTFSILGILVFRRHLFQIYLVITQNKSLK